MPWLNDTIAAADRPMSVAALAIVAEQFWGKRPPTPISGFPRADVAARGGRFLIDTSGMRSTPGPSAQLSCSAGGARRPCPARQRRGDARRVVWCAGPHFGGDHVEQFAVDGRWKPRAVNSPTTWAHRRCWPTAACTGTRPPRRESSCRSPTSIGSPAAPWAAVVVGALGGHRRAFTGSRWRRRATCVPGSSSCPSGRPDPVLTGRPGCS
jgi:hypothetical protein